MNIGYDGKRAYQNVTGLGNYSRSLITILAENHPANQHYVFAPKQTNLFDTTGLKNIHTITPSGIIGQKLQGWWRRSGMVKDIAAADIDLFHGLSNELPRGIQKTSAKTVVTIHDLIFERFPETYNFDERYVHRWKIKHACRVADTVIAISQQTKNDLVDFYKIPAAKIQICYQICSPIFGRAVDDTEKAIIKKKYGLPDRFFLFVSSITARKNLIVICKAMLLLKDNINIPLVVIGSGKQEKETVKNFMAQNGLVDRLIFLNDLPQSADDAFKTAADFPGIYQQALALIYPSIFEGFGLPILEAMASGLPVISSNTSSMPEVGGDAVLYFEPQDASALASHILEIATNPSLSETLTSKGFQQAKQFTAEKYAQSVMAVYKQILP